MAISKSAALAVISLVLLAGAVNAQKCTTTKQAQTATLANVAPKGCLKELIGAATGGEAAMQDLIVPECFNKLQLQRMDNKGTGCEPSSFMVEFDDKKKCAEGFDTIAEGQLTPAAKAGDFKASGNFTTGTPFTGALNAKNQLTVMVQGSNCELTYSLKNATTTANATKAADADAKVVNGEAKAAAGAKAANATDGAAAAAKPKSSASVSGASALMVLLGAVMALLL